MLHEEVIRYRELSGDANPNTPISRIGGYLDGYEKALEQEPILDKIKAEATSLKISYTDHDKDTYRRGINDVLKIIDKYKAESEVIEDVYDGR